MTTRSLRRSIVECPVDVRLGGPGPAGSHLRRSACIPCRLRIAVPAYPCYKLSKSRLKEKAFANVMRVAAILGTLYVQRRLGSRLLGAGAATAAASGATKGRQSRYRVGRGGACLRTSIHVQETTDEACPSRLALQLRRLLLEAPVWRPAARAASRCTP